MLRTALLPILYSGVWNLDSDVVERTHRVCDLVLK